MQHYKCLPCKARLRLSGSPTEPAGVACPECGSPMEPAARLADLVGLRSILSVDDAAAVSKDSGQPVGQRIDGFIRRRAVMLERDRFAAENWFGDDEERAAAVELPPPVMQP